MRSPLKLSRDIGPPTHMVEGDWNNTTISEKIAGMVLTRRTPPSWVWMFLVGFFWFNVFLVAVTWLFIKGIGIWGVDIPVAWGFAIANFVWWIGIGHAGTLISAILLLLRQDWRTSINRFAEAMTLFAVACAGSMPLLHLGRPWLFYWLLPYPNTMGLWPQFRSPLVWDVFAVSTYLIVSIIFWYVGLLPDVATFRDHAPTRFLRRFYGILALGWRNSAAHWKRYQTVYFIMAALAAPLVLSVHSIVSLDFAVAQVPGWHSTQFPPYFVAGAIYSGFAMVLTLSIPIRKVYHLEEIVTLRHLENCAKVMLATGMFVIYSYLNEYFMSWYSGDVYERYLTYNRALGPYGWVYFMMLFCNCVVPQIYWFKKWRRSIPALFIGSLLINFGMWTERVTIVIISLHRDFLPSSWAMFYPTIWDFATLLGSLGLFTTLFMLFLRSLPAVSVHEMRELIKKEAEAKAG